MPCRVGQPVGNQFVLCDRTNFALGSASPRPRRLFERRPERTPDRGKEICDALTVLWGQEEMQAEALVRMLTGAQAQRVTLVQEQFVGEFGVANRIVVRRRTQLVALDLRLLPFSPVPRHSGGQTKRQFSPFGVPSLLTKPLVLRAYQGSTRATTPASKVTCNTNWSMFLRFMVCSRWWAIAPLGGRSRSNTLMSKGRGVYKHCIEI